MEEELKKRCINKLEEINLKLNSNEIRFVIESLEEDE